MTSRRPPTPSSPTGSCWTARPPAPATPRRASCTTSSHGSRWPARCTGDDAALPLSFLAHGYLMALLDKLPTRILTVRGWGFLLTAVVALLFAQVLGRRDLLYVGVLLLALPLASLIVLRLVKPRFTVA